MARATPLAVKLGLRLYQKVSYKDCYGALPDGECCNTCSDVLYVSVSAPCFALLFMNFIINCMNVFLLVLQAYRMKRWALPRIDAPDNAQLKERDILDPRRASSNASRMAL